MTFRVSKKWLNKFSAYKKLASITVGYLDMETMNIVDTQMYIDGYQVKLVSDMHFAPPSGRWCVESGHPAL